MTAVIIMDAVWLGFIARSFYADALGNLLSGNIRYFPAFGVYILLTVGIIVCVLHHRQVVSLLSSGIVGACFGLVVYGVYELTNYTLIAGWPISVVVVDMIWGTALCSFLSVVGFLTGRKLQKK